MRNQQVNANLVRADARLNVLVKKQEEEHRHVIASHNKEMQDLRNALRMAMDKFTSLFDKSNNDLEDFNSKAISEINSLKQKVASQEAIIREQREAIASLNNQLNDFQDNYSTRRDTYDVTQALLAKINNCISNQVICSMDSQREAKSLFKLINEDLSDLRSETEKKLTTLSDKSDMNFSLFRLDKEGVLKQIRIYEKSMFIIEKKLENIYTLIERINQRG